MGFLKLVNEHTLDWLLKKYPNAFLLLTLIAKRAKRVDDDKTGLKKCQAYIGDYKECGLTEQKYRTAKRVLEINELITTQATNKGTIATLLNTRVYDINAEDDNEQKNTTQRSNNEQITTNKKLRSKKEEIKKEDNTLFEEFYKTYPRRVGRTNALKAFEKLKEPDRLIAIEAVKKQLEAGMFKLTEMQYIKHPATWLNAGCYLDEIVNSNGNGDGKKGYGPGLTDNGNNNGFKLDITKQGTLESMMERDGIKK